MDFQKVMRAYLRRIGQLPLAEKGPDFAGGSESPTPTEVDSEFLRNLVLAQAKVNRQALAFAFTLIAVVFFVSLLTAVKTGSSIPAILSIAGVGAGFEAGLLAWVSRLWREYNKFGYFLILSRGLSPDEFMKMVGTLYFVDSTRQKRGTLAKPQTT